MLCVVHRHGLDDSTARPSAVACEELRRENGGILHEEISCRMGRLGWGGCSAGREVKGLLWERVTADQQVGEIRRPGPRRAINRQNPA